MTQATAEAMAAEIGHLLTVAEAARIVRVTDVTIYQAVENGEIEDVIRIGARRGIRIPADSFRKYVKNRRINPAQADRGLAPAEATAA